MSDTYGPSSLRAFAFYDPDTSFWKTSLLILDLGLTPSQPTFPPWGIGTPGALYALPASEPATDEHGSLSLLPTPRAQNGESRNRNIWARPLGQPQNLENALALLPTPRAADGMNDYMDAAKARAERVGYRSTLEEAIALLPTPTAWLGRRPAHATGDSQRWTDPERSNEPSDFLAWLQEDMPLLPTPTANEPGWRNLEPVDRDGEPPAHANQRWYDKATGRLLQKGLHQVLHRLPGDDTSELSDATNGSSDDLLLPLWTEDN